MHASNKVKAFDPKLQKDMRSLTYQKFRKLVLNNQLTNYCLQNPKKKRQKQIPHACMHMINTT